MEFIHKGLPKKILKATRPVIASEAKQSKNKIASSLITPRNDKQWVETLEKIVSHGNVCSKEAIVRLYDHTVQGTSVLPPFSGIKNDAPNDAVIIRPLLDKSYGMVVSHGLNPVLNKIDPYWGSIWAATEAVSNFVSVGGNFEDASLIENFIWPFPDEESLWALDKSVDAVVNFMKVLKIPVISGKDSLSSTYRGADGTVIKIPPVLCISVFGKIPDVKKTSSLDFKKVGSTIILLGKQDLEMGGSTFYDIHGLLGNKVPKVDLKLLPKVLKGLHQAIQSRTVLSAHDISEGGLISAIFEMCLGGGMGAIINVSNLLSLLNETAGCFVVEVEKEEVAHKLFKNIPYKIIGKTTQKPTINVEKLFEVEVSRLEKAWKKPVEEIFS